MKLMCTFYIFQAGQPEPIRQQVADAMGLAPQEFHGVVIVRSP